MDVYGAKTLCGIRITVTPIKDDLFNPEEPVHHFYKRYHIPYVFQLEDNTHNILIMPESVTEFLYCFRKFQRVIWWMSVNNYLDNIIKIAELFLKNPLDRPLIRLFNFYGADKDSEHWGQSEYVRQFQAAP